MELNEYLEKSNGAKWYIHCCGLEQVANHLKFDSKGTKGKCGYCRSWRPAQEITSEKRGGQGGT